MLRVAILVTVLAASACAPAPRPATSDPPSLSSIQTPYGRYQLANVEAIELLYGEAQVALPSCGVEARVLLEMLRTVDIVFEGDEVRVNGQRWETRHIGRHATPIKFGSTDHVEAKQPGREPVSVTFSRSDNRGASGRLYYTRTEGAEPVCSDARQLRGRYRRH